MIRGWSGPIDSAVRELTDLPPPAAPRIASVRLGVPLAVSLMAHAGAALALLAMLPREPFGDGVTTLDAVSVSLVPAAELLPQSVAATAALPAAVQLPSPSDAPAAAQQIAPPAASTMVQPPHEAAPMTVVEVPEILLDVAVLLTPPVIPPDEPTAVPPRPLARDLPEAATPARPLAAAEPAHAAAIPQAAAAASAGDATRFARGVALAIARHRPTGIGRKGRVEVEFSLLQESGKLERARVVKSSGSEQLDKLALKAVERTTYPIPPPHLGPSQRTFRMPFAFE